MIAKDVVVGGGVDYSNKRLRLFWMTFGVGYKLLFSSASLPSRLAIGERS